MVAISMEEFTEAEIRQIVDFYKSDVGRKVVERSPALLAKSGEYGRQVAMEHLSEFADSITARTLEQKE
jgi:hypothetical protein